MIYIVGAGPGDVDLITVKGRELIEKADVIIYAGSLVSPKHLSYASDSCIIHNSALMTLDEVIDVIKEHYTEEGIIVRLHTGDPSLYGAIKEQMDALEELNFKYKIIPGVSSFVAAAAAIDSEFTLPDVSQTVILTRIKGRTDVPEKENLVSLAKHRASMALFLSITHIDNVVEQLIEGYGRSDVPVAVVYRASWEDEKVIRGTLDTIASQVKEEKILKQAQILVGDFIDSEYSKSKLYDETFSTEYRDAKK